MYAKFALFVALVLLALLWPVIAAGAVVLVIRAVLAFRNWQNLRDWSKVRRRLTAAAALTAMAAYGYGLSKLSDWGVKDLEDQCRFLPEGFHQPDARSSSLWLLHDTRCGLELVPGFVNTLVVGSVALSLVFVVSVTIVEIRSRRRVHGIFLR